MQRGEGIILKYIIASKNLNKRLQILEFTFEENNLKVIATGCKPFNDYNGDLYVYVELSTISGKKLKNDLRLKINLYDVEGNLYMSAFEDVFADEFAGYDTITIECKDSQHVLDRAFKGKLYVIKYD